MTLIIGALLLLAGLVIGGKIADRHWKDNAKTYIRMERDGRLYKVVYADSGEKTPLWSVDSHYDGICPVCDQLKG